MSILARFTSALAVSVVALSALTADALAARILLTNDDGYTAPGLTILKEVLERAGHDVTVVAPSGNRSGSSAAITTTAFAVTRISDKVWSLDATPATTVLFGISTVMKDNPPDLVISGTNAGANAGIATVISGTVGNAIAAITQFNPSIPAIAFSADLVETAPNGPLNRRHYRNVANFAARLVAKVERQKDRIDADGRFILNVNWPALAKEDLKGVRYGVQGQALTFAWGFREVAPGLYALAPTQATAEDDVANSDAELLGDGYVTITVLDGDYTAPEALRNVVTSVLGPLKP